MRLALTLAIYSQLEEYAKAIFDCGSACEAPSACMQEYGEDLETPVGRPNCNADDSDCLLVYEQEPLGMKFCKDQIVEAGFDNAKDYFYQHLFPDRQACDQYRCPEGNGIEGNDLYEFECAMLL